jgi:hypothetical protein
VIRADSRNLLSKERMKKFRATNLGKIKQRKDEEM